MASCGYCGKKSKKASSIIKHWKEDGCGIDKRWAKVAEAMRTGKEGSAKWWTRRILGTTGKPMTEEEKEERRRYNAEHKEDIADRRKEKRAKQKRIKEAVAEASGKLDRKRGRNV